MWLFLLRRLTGHHLARCLADQTNCGLSLVLILTSKAEHRQVIARKSYSYHFVVVTLCILTCDMEGYPLLTVIQRAT